jgi:hypothetical protein
VTAASGAGDLRIVCRTGQGAITGLVRSDTGPLETWRYDVLVTSSAAANRFSKRARLDRNGRFLLENVPADDYSVMAVVRVDGRRETRAGPVYSVHLEPGDTAQLEINISIR